MKPPAPALDDTWRRESDHRTLLDASEIMADQKRMAGAKKHHRKVAKAHSLAGRTLMGMSRGMGGGR